MTSVQPKPQINFVATALGAKLGPVLAGPRALQPYGLLVSGPQLGDSKGYASFDDAVSAAQKLSEGTKPATYVFQKKADAPFQVFELRRAQWKATPWPSEGRSRFAYSVSGSATFDKGSLGETGYSFSRRGVIAGGNWIEYRSPISTTRAIVDGDVLAVNREPVTPTNS
jgi:hypothetical protein